MKKAVVVFATHRPAAAIESIRRILPHVDLVLVATMYDKKFDHLYPRDKAKKAELGTELLTRDDDGMPPHCTTSTLERVKRSFPAECARRKIDCLAYWNTPYSLPGTAASLAASHAKNMLAEKIVVVEDGADVPDTAALGEMFSRMKRGECRRLTLSVV